ncbi:protein of unknown function [Streptomyces sp. KY75]|nr:protein of unknown function [Streptomyces sp. KY70]CAD5995484.1 protein of unknown function [Streptomyces sp. KY75]
MTSATRPSRRRYTCGSTSAGQRTCKIRSALSGNVASCCPGIGGTSTPHITEHIFEHASAAGSYLKRTGTGVTERRSWPMSVLPGRCERRSWPRSASVTGCP